MQATPKPAPTAVPSRGTEPPRAGHTPFTAIFSLFLQPRFSGQPAHHHGHERAPKSFQFLSVQSVTNNDALGLVNRALQPVQLGARSVVVAEAGLILVLQVPFIKLKIVPILVNAGV